MARIQGFGCFEKWIQLCKKIHLKLFSCWQLSGYGRSWRWETFLGRFALFYLWNRWPLICSVRGCLTLDSLKYGLRRVIGCRILSWGGFGTRERWKRILALSGKLRPFARKSCQFFGRKSAQTWCFRNCWWSLRDMCHLAWKRRRSTGMAPEAPWPYQAWRSCHRPKWRSGHL